MSIPSVSRAEIIQWINGVLDANYTKVEQCGTGAVYCQLLDSIYRAFSLFQKRTSSFLQIYDRKCATF